MPTITVMVPGHDTPVGSFRYVRYEHDLVVSNGNVWKSGGIGGIAVSRTTYDALFRLIGTFYGPGDGSTTFDLPSQGAVNAQGVIRLT